MAETATNTPVTNKNNGGMWRKMQKDGKTPYFSCNLEVNGSKIYFKAFRNSFKEEGSQQPDYRLVLDIPFEATETVVPKAKPVAAKPAAKKVVKPAPVVEEEIEETQEEELLLD